MEVYDSEGARKIIFGGRDILVGTDRVLRCMVHVRPGSMHPIHGLRLGPRSQYGRDDWKTLKFNHPAGDFSSSNLRPAGWKEGLLKTSLEGKGMASQDSQSCNGISASETGGLGILMVLQKFSLEVAFWRLMLLELPSHQLQHMLDLSW